MRNCMAVVPRVISDPSQPRLVWSSNQRICPDFDEAGHRNYVRW
jgi:hypothetical protein